MVGVVSLAGNASRYFPSGGGGGGVQLPSGNYVTQKFAMVAEYPRPDSETGTYGGTVNARHRWAYYDGANPVQYELAIRVFGGSAPHRFSVIAGPAGLIVGNLELSGSILVPDASTHGVVRWTPQAAFSTGAPAAVTIRVTGQDGNYIDVSWTIATESSTSRFVFIDASTGSDSNSGAIGSPFQTLAKVTGTLTTTTTYPGRIVYLRGGDYETVAQTNSWNGGNGSETLKCRIEINSTHQPMAVVAFPEEQVSVDFADAEITIGLSSVDDTGNDFLWSGNVTHPLRILGYAVNAAETHNFWNASKQDRTGLQWVSFEGFVPVNAGGFTNACPFFLSSAAGRQYAGVHGITSDCGLTCVLFYITYWVDQYCDSSIAASNHPGINYKDSTFYFSSRYGKYLLDSGDNEFAAMITGQSDSGWGEICYSFLKGPLWLHRNDVYSTGPIYSYRNTVYCTDSNYAPGIRAFNSVAIPSTGDYYSENDAVISVISPHISNGTGGMENISASGTECQSTAESSNKPFDPTTGLLQNNGGGTAFRTLYLGQRGWELAI